MRRARQDAPRRPIPKSCRPPGKIMRKIVRRPVALGGFGQ
jgi:hypothetical protein